MAATLQFLQTTFLHRVVTGMAALVLALSFISMLQTSLPAHAQGSIRPQECSFKDDITRISIADIMVPAKFIPIIPEECSTEDGQARPLSFAVIPDIGIRFFGALASLVFYLFGFIVLFSGIQWMYGGLDGQQSKQAKQNLRDSVLGLVLVVGVYVVVNSILLVLGVQGISTDLSSFFTGF